MKHKILMSFAFFFGVFATAAAQDPSIEIVEMDTFNEGYATDVIIATVVSVLVILVLLYLLFKLFGSIAILSSNQRAMKASGLSKEEAKGITRQSGEIFSAIAMAIYEATELHDEENAILTIKRTVSSYSPWSSKIYTLRETPRKK
jgi:hypothetical protein